MSLSLQHLLLAAAMAVPFGAMAADVVTVTARAAYYAPLTMTPFQARQEAIQRAQLDAISRRFGSSLSQTSISMQAEGINARDDFYAIGQSDVKGEWVETIGDTIWIITPGERETLYEVTLKGRIREIPSNRIDLDSRILFNGTDRDRDQLRGGSFNRGDYMYIYFTAPVDGYLAVYLGDDDPAMTMQCLIPYDGSGQGAFAVEAGKEYKLFSRDDAPAELRPYVRRIKMNCRKQTDINQIYVIFSPRPFTKAADSRSRRGQVARMADGTEVDLMPREADFASFQRWLGKARRGDPNMQVIKTVVTVSAP